MEAALMAESHHSLNKVAINRRLKMSQAHHFIKCTIATALATIVLTGCAAKKDFYAMGGSRADGSVDMAYDFKPFEKPVVNQQQAFSIAKQKCGVWGYSNAEPFGGQTVNCQQRDGWGNCVAGQVIVKYQCIGNIDASRPSVTSPAPSVMPAVNSTNADLLSRDQWKQSQLQRLQSETGLSYEEYSRRYKQIMGE
ncbi:YecR family lipoprotein [Stutzerimonas kunmingensis]|uniref:YecR family lipoprotein n=1 Tax=Stutzerimonas kunmingensis TaxID=1211807 RepID=UPI0028AD58AF|nr:YecR family lipoprotein [Stutzerimonas kunmingensis]